MTEEDPTGTEEVDPREHIRRIREQHLQPPDGETALERLRRERVKERIVREERGRR